MTTFTNSKLTDEHVSNATLIRLILWADQHNSHYVVAALRELQERRKADSVPVEINDDMAYAFHHALSDSSPGADEVEEIKAGLRAAFANVTAQPASVVPEAEPVAWTDEEELRDVKRYGLGEIFQYPPDKYADSRRVIPLYRVPPAVPQLPQPAVPGEIQKLKDGRGFKYVKDGVRYSVNYANGWNSCRAAMIECKDKIHICLNCVDVLVDIKNEREDKKRSEAIRALDSWMRDGYSAAQIYDLAISKGEIPGVRIE